MSDSHHGVTVGGAPDEKPAIQLPDGAPPAGLQSLDLTVGDGAEVPARATVTVHYVGVSWTNGGAEFDASWDRGETISFGLNQVISGWTEGIPGMKVGGRRLLIIPPDMGYGASSPTPAIAPNDTLVFVVDLVDVR